MSLNLQEIWRLQRELNIIIGRDTVGDPEKEKWFRDYTIALHDEATELFNCCSWKWWSLEYKEQGPYKLIDPENAKIEVIDCMHFLISLMQIMDYNLQDDVGSFERMFENAKKFDVYYFHLDAKDLIVKVAQLMEFDEIIKDERSPDSTYFKIYSIMLNLIKLFVILGFEKEDILKIYKMKHEKNILRQKNGYSVINKTEDDNNEIKAKIKN